MTLRKEGGALKQERPEWEAGRSCCRDSAEEEAGILLLRHTYVMGTAVYMDEWPERIDTHLIRPEMVEINT